MKTWSGKEEFLQLRQRPLVMKNITIGFIKSVGNLRFVGIDDAGHMVPRDQPEWTLLLLERFLNGNL
jgi:carboxypeptidase C (cathepsin A)